VPTAAIKARGCTTQASAYKGKVSPWQSRVLLLRLRRPSAFGKLLYAGKDWTDYKLGRYAMTLMAEPSFAAPYAHLKG